MKVPHPKRTLLVHGSSDRPRQSNVVRLGCLKAGDLAKFYATPWIPYSLDEDRRNVFASVYRRCLQGLAEVQQIRLTAAERYYLDAVALAEPWTFDKPHASRWHQLGRNGLWLLACPHF